MDYCLKFEQLRMNDVGRVGGKNASLGEMISSLASMGVSVPTGYATTADAFRAFLGQSGLDNKIHDLLDNLDIDDVDALAKAGAEIRRWVVETPFIPELEQSIRQGYRELCGNSNAKGDVPVAIRSSA
ncbi:MAG: PEP/pyruvate-binding domain-containing protein, partial [Pseudomonadales bacterium]